MKDMQQWTPDLRRRAAGFLRDEVAPLDARAMDDLREVVR